MSFSKNFVWLLLTVLAFTACLKDQDLPKKVAPIDINAGLPVVNSQMTIGNAVDKTKPNFSLLVNKEGYYTFLFNPSIHRFPEAQEYIVLKDISFFRNQNGFNSSLTIPANSPTGITGPDQSFVLTLAGYGDNAFKGAEIRNILYKGGKIYVKMSSTYDKKVNFKLVFNSIKKNNLPLEMSFELDASVVGKDTMTRSQDLIGYSFDLSNGTTGETNKIGFKIIVEPLTNASSNSGTLNMEHMIFGSQQWSRIDGKFSNIDIPVATDTIPVTSSKFASNSIELVPFSNNDNSDPEATSMDFEFVNPIMYGQIYNTFGMPMRLIVKPIQAVGISDQVLDTTSQSFDIPKGNSLQVINQVPSPYDYTVSGVNFQRILRKGPKELRYGMVMRLNPSTDLATESANFMLDTSRISAKANVELPLNGKFTLFNLKSVVDNPLYESATEAGVTTSGIAINANNAELRFAYENTMPIGFEIKLVMLDENKNPIFYPLGSTSEFQINLTGGSSLVKAAPVGTDGFTIENGKINTYSSPSKVQMTTDQFDVMKAKAKYFRIVARMSSTTDASGARQNVKIRPQDYIIIRLSAAINGQLELGK
jgi:hypothetical protein